jgi:predicted PurR-regulated permease PerM
MPKTIEISHRTVIFTVLFLGLIWFLIQISSIILSIFVAVLLMTALNPLVDRLERLRLPRLLSIFLVYLVIVGLFVGGISSLLPPLIEQSTNLGTKLPAIFDQAIVWFKDLGIGNLDKQALSSQLSQLGALPGNIVLIIAAVFSNLISVFTVLVISFYLLLERKNMDNHLVGLFGEGNEQEARNFIDKLETRLGGWVRGELMLMTIIGVLTYIGLSLLGIPYALPLAILAGFLEIIPGIGPILSAIPGILLGLTISPVMAIAAAALYFLIQQIENTVIVPKVMQKATGINPLVTMISLAVGFKMAGVLGAILAVPIVIVLHVFVVEILSWKRIK